MFTHMILGPAGSGKTTHLSLMKEKAIKNGFSVVEAVTTQIDKGRLSRVIKNFGSKQVVLLFDEDINSRSRKLIDMFLSDPTIRERIAHVFIVQQAPEKNNWYQL